MPGTEVELDRREYMQLGVILGTAIPASFRLGEEFVGVMEENSFYSGVPDVYAGSDWFHEKLLEQYPDGQVEPLAEDQPNIILDFRYVEGEEMPPEALNFIESEFESHGVNTVVLEYREEFPRDEFIENYGARTGNILGSDRPIDVTLGLNEGLYGRVEDYMKEAAIQVFCVPGLESGEHKGHLVRKTLEGKEYPVGVAVGSRAALSSNAGEEGYSSYEAFVNSRENVAMHEIGHTLGLDHSNNMENVMYEESSTGSATYNEDQWSQVKAQLS